MDQNYRGCLLRGSNLRGKPQVAVFAGKERLHIADGETIDDAFVNARIWVDASQAEDAKDRPLGGNAAAVKEYVRYFKTHPLKDFEIAMLRANAQKPLTAVQLAAAAGWDHYENANAHYGTLGGKVGRELGLAFDRYKNGKEFLMSALVKELDEREPETGHRRFEMHPELVEALKQLGIA